MAITVIDNLDNLNIFNTVTTAQAGRCYIDYTHRFFANNTQAKKYYERRKFVSDKNYTLTRKT